MTIKFLFITILSFTLPTSHQIEVNKFDQLLEEFYQEGLELNPFIATVFNSDNRNADQFEITISDDFRDKFVRYYQKYQSALLKFNREDLTAEQKMSFDILDWECKINLESTKFSEHLTPINQFWCLPFTVNQQANGAGAVPFKTVADYENWLKRLDQFVLWIDLAISRMEEGIEVNYVLPKVLVEKMIPQYTSLAKGLAKEHLFYGSIKNMPKNFSLENRTYLSDLYQTMISEEIIPAYNRLLIFLQNVYMPNSRESHGLSDLPGGAEYYKYLIKVQTTTEIMRQVNFSGTLIDFFNHVKTNPKLMPFDTPEEVLKNFESIHSTIQPHLNELFDIDINIPFEIRRVPAYLEASASASYSPGAVDGSRPGIFFVPVPDATKYNTYSDEALFLHEAILFALFVLYMLLKSSLF